MSLDASQITAVGTATAAVLGAIGVILKIVTTRPRLPVADELFEQVDELRTELLQLAAWVHDARMIAAANGLELPPPPDVIRVEGRRQGEGRHGRHGIRAAVRVQTGEQLAVVDDGPPPPPPERRRGPDTRPDRRVRPAPPE